MTARSFNYYGYSKESYMECSALIRSTNRRHITILNTWFMLINLLYIVFSALNLFGVNQERIPLYGLYLLASIAFELWLLIFPKAIEHNNYIAVFTSIILLLSYGILSSISEPYIPATPFLVLLTLATLSYIGNMALLILITLVSVGIFLATSYIYKDFSIAYRDSYNSVIVMTLIFALHYSFQRTRLSQFILYQRDQQVQKELEIKSSFDALTTLLNRGTFFSITREVLRSLQDEYMTLCLFDLDGFKQINDNLGHQMGDKVIQTVGKTIMKHLGLNSDMENSVAEWDISLPMSVVGRLGGDEFIVLLRGKKDRKETEEFLQEVLSDLNSVKFDGLDGIHASIGVTEIPLTDKDIDNAYKWADEALYESKRSGKNQIHFSPN